MITLGGLWQVLVMIVTGIAILLAAICFAILLYVFGAMILAMFKGDKKKKK